MPDDEISSTDQRFYDAYDGLDVEGVEFEMDSDVDEALEDDYSDE